MMLLLLLANEPVEVDDSNIIEFKERQTLKVQRIEDDELEVVDEPVEPVARAKRTVEKVQKAPKVQKVKAAGQTLAEQLVGWKKQHSM